MTTMDMLYPSSQAMEMFKKQEEGDHALSYFCKICSKRFLSGRALGGHMRAHATASIAPDTLTESNFQKSKRPRASDHKSMEGKEKEEWLDSNGSKLMYDLRKNPKRSCWFAEQDYSFLLGDRFYSKPIDSSINCDLCEKQFTSLKGLFDHMKCHTEINQDSSDAHLEGSQQHEIQEEEEESESDAEIGTEVDHPAGDLNSFDKWMKGKRSRRPWYAVQSINPGLETNNEEEDMAMCLVMLASGVNTAQNPQAQDGVEDLGSGGLKFPNTGSQVPKCIRKKPKYKKIDGEVILYADDEVKKAMHKCTTCNKVFHSHQALGGHRASHNKVKGSFSQIEEDESLGEEITDEELQLMSGSYSFQKPRPKKRAKDSTVKARAVKAKAETVTIEPARFSGKKTSVHECSICHRVFHSGQGLGGHKRCHWGNGASDTVSTIFSNKNTSMLQQQKPARLQLLDLNLPTPVDDDDCDAGNLNNLDGNAVDSHGISNAKRHSPPYLQPSLMGLRCPKQGLFLYNNDADLDGNAVDSHGISNAKRHNPPYLQPSLMGLRCPKQGLFLYNNDADLSKDDEANSNLGKKDGFDRECDSDFPVRAQPPWL